MLDICQYQRFQLLQGSHAYHHTRQQAGVEKASWYTLVINRTYHEMAEHYGTVIIPARVCRPKDKPNVEGSINSVSTWILAALRNETFSTLNELNNAIRGKIKALNSKPFQKKTGSKLSVLKRSPSKKYL